jgi:small subunit ribosomal protein S3
MGQKTHPLGFRIGITQRHKSAWFANSQAYPTFLEFKIRNHIEEK